MARLAEVVRGLSFRDSDQPRDRISGASLVLVAAGLIEPTAAPAGQITDQRGLRVVQRVLAFLRAEGLICERHFREGGSPRVMRSIDWERLEAWIDQPASGYQKKRVPCQAAWEELTTKAREEFTTEAQRHGEEQSQEDMPEMNAPCPANETKNQESGTDTPSSSVPPCLRGELSSLVPELVSLGVMPDCLDSTALPLPKIRRLIDHFKASGLENALGEMEYAWGPGLLYARICSPKLAMLGPDNWPVSVNKEWKRLKAIADRQRRLAREEAERNLNRKAEDDRSSLHQLELRFPELRDAETVMSRLMALPDPPQFLMSRIRKAGLNSNLKTLALMAIAAVDDKA